MDDLYLSEPLLSKISTQIDHEADSVEPSILDFQKGVRISDVEKGSEDMNWVVYGLLNPRPTPRRNIFKGLNRSFTDQSRDHPVPRSASAHSWQTYHQYAEKIERDARFWSLKALGTSVKRMDLDLFQSARDEVASRRLATALAPVIDLTLQCLRQKLDYRERIWALGLLSCLKVQTQPHFPNLVPDVQDHHLVQQGALELSLLKGQ